MTSQGVDAVLVQWGERLFYPPNRIRRATLTPRLQTLLRRKAAVIRGHIQAAVRRAPQVMVKVAGGGRGMKDIGGHLRYISRDGTLQLEDDRGELHAGQDGLKDLSDRWRYGGARIPEVSHRREAVNLMLSMPHGTDPALVLAAARAFARAELPDNLYAMVLHEHQAHPHVHLTVRTESRSGERLRTWSNRYRWRESFAGKLRELGVDAAATPQWARGEIRRSKPLWEARGEELGLVRSPHAAVKSGERGNEKRADSMRCWAHILDALARSPLPEDRELADRAAGFVRGTPFLAEVARRQEAVQRDRGDVQRQTERNMIRSGPEITR